MSYILSNSNRLYTALESSYGVIPVITAANRIPLVKLGLQQYWEVPTRRDKTGSRTWPGVEAGGRLRTTFELLSYLTSWQKPNPGPSYGPLFQSALGAAPSEFLGGTVASAVDGGNIALTAPHGLTPGQAIATATEIRFVAAIPDPTHVILNAPFLTVPVAGDTLQSTVTYSPATNLPSVSIFDYWSPVTAVQRLLYGAVVNDLEIRVNGDYHEFQFSGLARDVLDSSSFTSGMAGLTTYPLEPAAASFDYTIVPGNLGEAWLGTTPAKFCTVTSALVSLKNNIESRSSEFGCCGLPQAMAPGSRDVELSLELYSQDDSATESLYQAARQKSPISVMFQLGKTSSQMMAVYLQSVIPAVPEFIDTQNRQQWKFRPSRAQGTIDNEIQVAFA